MREKKRRLSFSPPKVKLSIGHKFAPPTVIPFQSPPPLFFWELFGPPDFKSNSKLVGEDSAKTIGIEPIFPACRLVLRGGNKISGDREGGSEGPIGGGLKRGEREKKIGSFFYSTFPFSVLFSRPPRRRPERKKTFHRFSPPRSRTWMNV